MRIAKIKTRTANARRPFGHGHRRQELEHQREREADREKRSRVFDTEHWREMWQFRAAERYRGKSCQMGRSWTLLRRFKAMDQTDTDLTGRLVHFQIKG